MSTYKLINGDCIAEMKKIDAISSIDTDKHKEASKDKDIDTQYFFDNI